MGDNDILYRQLLIGLKLSVIEIVLAANTLYCAAIAKELYKVIETG